MTKTERRVFTPADILARAQAGESTTDLHEGRVAIETWSDGEVELRADGDGMTFSGYAAVFNSRSDDLGGFRETIRPGAFDKTLGEKRAVKMFWNHNTDIPLGSTRSSMSLTPDKRGLLAVNRFPDTTAGRDMSVLVRDKIVDSMSFGFQTVKDSWSEDLTHRELVEVRLFEVSPVTGWPAYPATSASVRHLAETIDADPDELAAAFLVLRSDDQKLSDVQSRLLSDLINARTDKPLRRAFSADDEAMYQRFAAVLS